MKTWSATVPLDLIDEQDLTFAVHFRLSDSALEKSIAKVGLLSPPVFQKTAGNGYRIVRGFRRVGALKTAKITEFKGVAMEENAPVLSLLAEGIHDNLASDNLNVIDKALIVAKLSQLLPPDVVIESYFELLKLHPTQKNFERQLALDSLEPEIKESVIKGILHENSACKLSRLSGPSQRLSLHRLLKKLKLSAGKQQEMIEQIKELAERGKVTVKEITAADQIREILRDDRLDRPQKGGKLRMWLKRQLLPTLSAYEDSFKKKRRSLSLDREVRLTAPPFFEGDRFRVDFSFKSREDFKDRLELLKTAAETRELEDILNLNLS